MRAYWIVLLLAVFVSLISISDVYAAPNIHESRHSDRNLPSFFDDLQINLVFDDWFSESFNMYLIVALVPFALFVLLRSDKESMLEFGPLSFNAQKFFSVCFAFILLSPFGVIPLYASTNLGLAFAEEISNQTSVEIIPPPDEQTDPPPDEQTDPPPDEQTDPPPDEQTDPLPTNSTEPIQELVTNSTEPIQELVTNSTESGVQIVLPNATETWQFDTQVNGSHFIGDVSIEETDSSLILGGDGYITNDGDSTSDISNISVTAWVNPDYSGGSAEFTVISKEKSFALTINNNIAPQQIAKFAVFDGIKWHTVESSTQIGDDWSHIAATFNGTTLSIYTNGTISNVNESLDTITINLDGQLELKTIETISTSSDIVIGASLENHRSTNDVTKQFYGELKEINIFDTYLSEDQILEIYLQTLPVIQDLYTDSMLGASSIVDDVDTIENVIKNDVSSNLTSSLSHAEIEIGKPVTWTQTIVLDDFESIIVDDVIIELPEDAENIQVDVDDAAIISDSDTNSMMLLAPLNMAITESLDEILQEDKSTKLLTVDQSATEYSVTFETSSPSVTETDLSSEDSFNKMITVSHESALHYTNVTSFADIPEEYVLFGTPFVLEWVINGTTVNVLEDPRFEVEFIDTDGNGLTDRVEWNVPQLSEQTFSLKADISDAESVDVSSKLSAIRSKLDTGFYKKTLDLLNARASSKLNEYLSESRNLADVSLVDEYYDIMLIPKSGSGSEQEIRQGIRVNMDQIVNDLELFHNAKNIFKAEKLSFVTASIPVNEIPKLTDYGYVKIIGDGELPIQFELNTSKATMNAVDIPFGATFLDGSGVVVAVIDSGVEEHEALPSTEPLPENNKVIQRLFCDIVKCTDTPQPFQIGDGPLEDIGPGHGTMVAGIIAGFEGAQGSTLEPSGVATGAKIIDAHHGVNTNDQSASSNALARSIDLSLQYGAEVINMSIAIDANEAPCSFTTVNHVVDEAVDQGVVFVKSSGNGGNVGSPPASRVTDPGCAFNVITVGSYNEFTSDIEAGSSRGPVSQSEPRLKPEIVAPGVRILSPVQTGGWDGDPPPGVNTISGTSFAAPQVSGAVALLLQSHPEATPLEIRTALMLGAQWNPSKINPTLPLTANTYEDATAIWFTGQTPSGSLTNHEKLNEWGFGLIDVTQSNNLLAGNFVQLDHFVETATTPIEYNFDALLNEEVKIILSWKNRPTLNSGTSLSESGNIISSVTSNLDLSVKRAGGVPILHESVSTFQNNEFIVFIAPEDAEYTITVTPHTITSGIGTEPFVLGSTKSLTPGTGNTGNTAPTALVSNLNNDKVLRSGETFPVGITGVDDEVTFFITDQPDKGFLSAFRHLNDGGYTAIIEYTASDTFSGVDSFTFVPYDGSLTGAPVTVNVAESEAALTTNVISNGIQTAGESIVSSFSSGGSEIQSISLPSAGSIGGIKVDANSVLGLVLQYEYSSTSYTEYIPPNTNKVLQFDSLETLTDVKLSKQASFNDDAVVGYIDDVAPTNFPPTAEISEGFIQVDEGTLVVLDGTGSSDFDGPAALTYDWEQGVTGAPFAELNSTTSAAVEFIAPDLPYPSTVNMLYTLTVFDGIDSDIDNVVVQVSALPPVNNPPIASEYV